MGANGKELDKQGVEDLLERVVSAGSRESSQIARRIRSSIAKTHAREIPIHRSRRAGGIDSLVESLTEATPSQTSTIATDIKNMIRSPTPRVSPGMSGASQRLPSNESAASSIALKIAIGTCILNLTILISYGLRLGIAQSASFASVFTKTDAAVFSAAAIFNLPAFQLLFTSIKRLSGDLAAIHKPPAWRLRNFAEFILSGKTFELVFSPLLADFEQEYMEALAQKRFQYARWVRVRCYVSFWTTLVFHLQVSLAKSILHIMKI